MNILFLGYGKMGSALGEMWLSGKVAQKIVAIDPHASGLVYQADCLVDIECVQGTRFDVIVVAVKPNLVTDVLEKLSAEILSGACIVSLAAGVSVSSVESATATKVPIVRAMPNAAVQVNAGCTALYTNHPLADYRFELINKLFESVGKAFWLDKEEQLDAVTAISGSGPAYYHLFSEALADAAESLGLPASLSRDLVACTAYGAAKLQCLPEANLQMLRHTVTSPNGTTHAAIEVFEQDYALRELIIAASNAAYNRARELSGSTSMDPLQRRNSAFFE